MATVLTLAGTQVFPDGKQQIKLVRENPYFTQSESYTLDVTLPMDILENRQFFRNIHRLEHGKAVASMPCRLEVNNKPLLVGTARVTQIQERDIKVQLVGGLSEVKFLSAENQTYIDEMDLDAVACVTMPAHDETYEDDVNRWCNGSNMIPGYNAYWPEAPQPNLVGIMRRVLELSGYTVGYNDTDAEPWNCIYVASAKRTASVAHALPHWTVKEFIDEYCRFFNCSLVVHQVTHTVDIVANSSYFGSARHMELEPVDEYTVELTDEDEAKSLATSNLRFDLSGSSEHDYDIIPDRVRDTAPVKDFASRREAQAAYAQMDEEERKRYIFRTPLGMYASWDIPKEDGTAGVVNGFAEIDVFGPLVRNAEDESEISLKIVPVAIARTVLEYHDYYEEVFHPVEPGKHPWRYVSLENPTGNEYHRWGSAVDDPTVPSDEDATIQDYVEGEASTENAEKEDRMQVFFVDDRKMLSVSYGGWNEDSSFEALMPFTDYLYKRMPGASHRQWSMSLKPSSAARYLGQLHRNDYSFNMKAKYCVKFLADDMPDPTQVFLIRNKRFACEKIEAGVDDRGLQRLMTGYFYEML